MLPQVSICSALLHSFSQHLLILCGHLGSCPGNALHLLKMRIAASSSTEVWDCEVLQQDVDMLQHCCNSTVSSLYLNLITCSRLVLMMGARREYDRLEADAVKLHCKPKYSLASTDHETLVKSTVDLACNPKLKGKVPSAIKQVLAHGAALEELTIGMASLYQATQGTEWVMQPS